MSKVGQKPITIPSGVQVEVKDSTVSVKGQKGQLSHVLPKELTAKVEGESLLVTRSEDTKDQKAIHGLFRNILANSIKGVSEGWTKKLVIVGTGFNVKMQGQAIALKVGYSHTVIYQPVPGIQLSTEGNTTVIVSGFDKQLVGQIAHQIKTVRMPDVYKGKGLRYQGERIRTKPGKKAKAA